jgi:hypothetical protein
MPNAGGEPRSRAAATQERRLLGVGSTAGLGPVPTLGGWRKWFLIPFLCISCPRGTHRDAWSTCSALMRSQVMPICWNMLMAQVRYSLAFASSPQPWSRRA